MRHQLSLLAQLAQELRQVLVLVGVLVWVLGQPVQLWLAKLQRQRDERKARLAAKRKAKEEAEAAEAAAAAAAATAIGGAAPDASSATPPAPAITAPSTSGVDVGLPT